MATLDMVEEQVDPGTAARHTIFNLTQRFGRPDRIRYGSYGGSDNWLTLDDLYGTDRVEASSFGLLVTRHLSGDRTSSTLIPYHAITDISWGLE